MNENIYWTFSAAAQSISAFIAFLVTGYALVHSFMQAASAKDDSLIDIHSRILEDYHRQLVTLSVLTGCSIVLSLTVVYVNKWQFDFKNYLVFAVASVDVISVSWGLLFVTSIVDSKKYRKAALKVLENEFPKSEEKAAASSLFFDEFIKFEKLLRDEVEMEMGHADLDLLGNRPLNKYSPRELVNILLVQERISSVLAQKIYDVLRIRNLLFHGHLETVDSVALERLRECVNQVQSLPKRLSRPRGKFGEMLTKSREGATHGNLEAIRSAVRNFHADHNAFPVHLDREPFVGSYIETLPSEKVTGGSQVVGKWDGKGGWCYNKRTGKVSVNVGGKDTNGKSYKKY